MLNNDLSRFKRTPAACLGRPRRLRVIRFDITQVDIMKASLSDTLSNGAFYKCLLPGDEMPRTLRDFLFCSIARSNQVSGEVYVTDDMAGGAVFASRGEEFSFERLARAIISTTRFKLGRSGFRRCSKVWARLKAVHGRLAVGRHWYLMSLGIKLSKPENASALLQPLLSRADADRVPCYIEIFRETELPFYECLGFRIEGAGRIPGGGPNFWAMLRLPQ